VQLQVITEGGVQDLARIVGILGLLNLTPAEMRARREGKGLVIGLSIDADECTTALCLARIRALVCVREAEPVVVAPA
jgi:hypothetical protein